MVRFPSQGLPIIFDRCSLPVLDCLTPVSSIIVHVYDVCMGRLCLYHQFNRPTHVYTYFIRNNIQFSKNDDFKWVSCYIFCKGKFTERLYVAYTTYYCVGQLMAMCIPFVGFQPVTTSEHMAGFGVFGLIQVNIF